MIVCGVDEAGRGPMFGPLVVAGVAIERSKLSKLRRLGIRDSKKLSPARREQLYSAIIKIADAYTVSRIQPHTVYNERLVVKKGIEYRTWDPFRSKLAASIKNGLETFPFKRGSSVLYLGVSSGTTASHISDIVGVKGMMFCVEHASRVARDFLDRVASHRKNIVPVLQDARRPREYSAVYGKVDIVYADIAQPDQTQIVLENCQMYLKDGGVMFLVIKTRSIR